MSHCWESGFKKKVTFFIFLLVLAQRALLRECDQETISRALQSVAPYEYNIWQKFWLFIGLKTIRN